MAELADLIRTQARPVREVRGPRADALSDELLQAVEPVVVRGLVAHWPVVQAAQQSARSAIEYLRGFDRGMQVVAQVAPAEIEGRIFYTDDLSGFNFQPQRVAFKTVLDQLEGWLDQSTTPLLYMGSTTIDTTLAGFREHNDLVFEGQNPLASIWLGNRSRIAAHQDLPDNIACVVAGRRRVTLFPPDQLKNLYIGPLDFTPAGQAISLVDFAAPDLQRFPRFAEAVPHAQVVELEPGDALLIPSLWWHHIEALDSFNVLVNYWWRRSPAYMDTPMNTLMMALLTLRDLPAEQRRHWQEIFRHYVFEPGPDTHAHIPDAARRVLGPLDENLARELRARLLQRLNR